MASLEFVRLSSFKPLLGVTKLRDKGQGANVSYIDSRYKSAGLWTKVRVALVVIHDEGFDLVAEFRNGFAWINLQPVPYDGPLEALNPAVVNGSSFAIH